MKNDNGIGFKGVLLQTESREYVQCYECAQWFGFVNEVHLKKHGITTAEYKERYGFNKNTGMVSDSTQKTLTENGIRLAKQNGEQGWMNGLKDAWKRDYTSYKQDNSTVEKQNTKGTCPTTCLWSR